MADMLVKIVEMKAVLWLNSFFYYFRRLWLVGRLMPESVYAGTALKRVLSYVAVAVQQIAGFFGKPLYLLLFAGLPALWLQAGYPQAAGQPFALFAAIIFFLNCILGSFGDSTVFSVTREKVTFLKYMRVNARRYIQAALLLHYVPFLAYYLFWFIVAACLLGAGPATGTALWLVFTAFRMLGEAVQVYLYDKTGKVLSRSTAYGLVLIALGLAGAYLPAALGLQWPVVLAGVLLHPAVVAVCVLVGAGCAYYVVWGYRGYERKLPRSLDLNFLLSTLLKASAAAPAKDVEVKESDAELEAGQYARLQRLKGYDYLNAMFFARHRRQLVRPVWYRLAIAGVALCSALAFALWQPEAARSLSRSLTAMLPSFVFIMYGMTVAEKACRAMFYNCDKDLLRYAWYRTPGVILRCFAIRLRRVALYNGIVAAALCLAAAVFCFACGAGIFTADFWLFCAAILLLSLLFTAHHLCLYYIFQPYSESMRVKNPMFNVVNWGMYFLCFLCLKIDVDGLVFTLAVLAFTIVYIAVVLTLVYIRAPKSFRVK